MFEGNLSAINAISENKGSESTSGCGDLGSGHLQPWDPEAAAPGHRDGGNKNTEIQHCGRQPSACSVLRILPGSANTVHAKTLVHTHSALHERLGAVRISGDLVSQGRASSLSKF